jgi:hypothetical protein
MFITLACIFYSDGNSGFVMIDGGSDSHEPEEMIECLINKK